MASEEKGAQHLVMVGVVATVWVLVVELEGLFVIELTSLGSSAV